MTSYAPSVSIATTQWFSKLLAKDNNQLMYIISPWPSPGRHTLTVCAFVYGHSSRPLLPPSAVEERVRAPFGLHSAAVCTRLPTHSLALCRAVDSCLQLCCARAANFVPLCCFLSRQVSYRVCNRTFGVSFRLWDSVFRIYLVTTYLCLDGQWAIFMFICIYVIFTD